MKTSALLLRLLLIATLTAQLGTFSVAAEPAPTSENNAAAPSAQPPVPINLSFPGGTLSQLLSVLSQEKNLTFNLIGAGSPADFETALPPFSLHNVNGVIIAEVLRGLLQSRGYNLQISPIDGNSVTCVLVPLPENNPADPFMQDQFQSFELSPYLVNFSVDQIVDAIRSAWELNPAHPRDSLRVKFHPGTGILLVSGPMKAVAMTQDIISNLRRDTPPKNEGRSPAAKP